MSKTGYLLLIAGFLAGAYATSLDVDAVNWPLFIPAALCAVIGLVLIKLGARGEARSEQVLTANKQLLETSLDQLIVAVDAIAAARMQSGGAAEELISTDNLRKEIDARLRDDLRQFADVRQSLVHLYGIQAYADIMSDFAAGERSVNRVWSASTDGYGAEADEYLGRAASRFRAAQQRLKEVDGAA